MYQTLLTFIILALNACGPQVPINPNLLLKSFPEDQQTAVHIDSSIRLSFSKGLVGAPKVRVYYWEGVVRKEHALEGLSVVDNHYVLTVLNSLKPLTQYEVEISGNAKANYHPLAKTIRFQTDTTPNLTLQWSITSKHIDEVAPLKSEGEEGEYWTEERMKNAIFVSAKLNIVTQKEEDEETQFLPQFTSTDLEGYDLGALPLGKLSENNLPLDNPPLDITRKVTTPLSQYPYSTTGQVYFTENGRNYICSGSVIAPHVILTAAHCMTDGNGRWHSNWTFIPQKKGLSSPLGRYRAWYFAAFDDYHIKRRFERDVGMVIVRPINSTPIGHETGYLGFHYNYLTPGNFVSALGYPADNSRYKNYNFSGDEMYETLDKVRKIESHRFPITMQIGSYQTGGCSGGPWITQKALDNPDYNFAMGVNSYYYSSIEGETYSPYFDSSVKRLKDYVTNKFQ